MTTPLSNNSFSRNRSYAIWTNITNLYSISPNNTFTRDIGNQIYVDSGTLPSTLTLYSGFTYRLSSTTIPETMSLIVQPDTIIKLSGSTLTINGTLTASGTVDRPVYITSFKDDSVGGDINNDGSATSPEPGDWRQIVLANGTSATFDLHTTIRYGGYYDYGYYPCISAPYNSTVTLLFLEVSFSKRAGKFQ